MFLRAHTRAAPVQERRIHHLHPGAARRGHPSPSGRWPPATPRPARTPARRRGARAAAPPSGPARSRLPPPAGSADRLSAPPPRAPACGPRTSPTRTRARGTTGRPIGGERVVPPDVGVDAGGAGNVAEDAVVAGGAASSDAPGPLEAIHHERVLEVSPTISSNSRNARLRPRAAGRVPPANPPDAAGDHARRAAAGFPSSRSSRRRSRSRMRKQWECATAYPVSLAIMPTSPTWL